jgi:hypothetical protein
MSNTDFALGTIVFTVHDNEFRSSKIKRIVIDENGTNYIMIIDGTPVERGKREIDKSKEGLYNKLVEKHAARQNK